MRSNLRLVVLITGRITSCRARLKNRQLPHITFEVPLMKTAIKSVALCCALLPLQSIAAETDVKTAEVNAAEVNTTEVQTTKSTSSWDFNVEIYGQLTNINGSSQMGPISADLDLSPNDIYSNLKMGGMIQTGGIHSSGWGYSLDYAFMDLDPQHEDMPAIGALIHQGVLEAKGFKRYEYDFGTIDYMAGIRWWDMSVEGAGGLVEGGADWVDYVVGARYSKQFARDWTFEVLVDAGAGADTDFTGQINTGVRYAINDWSEIHVAYKAVWVDYDNGNGVLPIEDKQFGYDTVTHGLLAGWNIKF